MERINRRQLLTRGGAAAIAGALLGPSVANAQADKPVASPWAPVMDLVLDPASMESVRPPSGAGGATGPFSVSGQLRRTADAPGAPPIGTYRAWGWTWDPTRMLGGAGAVQSFDIAGQGEIVVSGMQDNRASITGGTGNYRGIGGQVDVVALSQTSFRLTFDFTSWRHGPN